MARKVLPSGQSTFAADQPALQPSQGLKTIGEGVGAVVSVGMDIYKQSQKALTDNQFAEGSLQMDDEWSAVLSKNSNDLDQERVFGNYEKAYNNQIAGIDKMQNLTDNARNALKQRAGANLNSAKQSFRNNLANATAKAATESMSRQIDWFIENRADEDTVYNYFGMQVSNGLLTQDAAQTMFENASDLIKVGEVNDVIAIEENTVDDLDAIAASVEKRSDISQKNKGLIYEKIRAQKSRKFTEEAEYIIGLQPKLKAGSLTQTDVDFIKDPEQNAIWQAKLDMMNGEVTGSEAEILAKRNEAAAKARAAEAELLVAGANKKKYTKYSSLGTDSIETYEMTPAEHHQRLKLEMHKFNSGLGVLNLDGSNQVYTGGNARKYLMMEIAAIADNNLREELEGTLLTMLADPEKNGNLFDVNEKAAKKPQAWLRKGSLYPKALQQPIRDYEGKVKKQLESLGISLDQADLELLRAFNNGLDYIQTSYNTDSGLFKANQNKIIDAALTELNIAASNKKVAKAVDQKLGNPTVAPTANPQVQQAVQWLQNNPNDPNAPAVRQKLQQMGINI